MLRVGAIHSPSCKWLLKSSGSAPIAVSDGDSVRSTYDRPISLLNSWYLPAVNRFHKPIILDVEYDSAHTSALETYAFGPQIAQGRPADPSVASDYDEQRRALPGSTSRVRRNPVGTGRLLLRLLI